MADIQTRKGSEYAQRSFAGGMNLLGDDANLATDQYRVGFNLTNRLGSLDPILQAVVDPALQPGLIQEMKTFGNFIIVFVAGLAYYRFFTDTGWKVIETFKMSPDAPRYWTEFVPVSITNYVRIAATGITNTGTPDPNGSIQFSAVAGASEGNVPGLLVQDNINQPQFIFLGLDGIPTSRVTQRFNQWSATYTDATNTVFAPDGDKREYVPIGNAMAWEDGVLYIASQDGNQILRSVSGRPLDFAINVKNTLETVAPYTQTPGGDAFTTSYSVGVGGITCLRAMSAGGIFVAAANACFAVTKNLSNNAPKIFGEYTFLRTFLFNATCLSDRVIFDTLGDTRFIGLTGVRSFNSIQQTQNEGRNEPFASTIQAAFGTDDAPIIQSADKAAGILFNDYELYAVNTIFGPAIAKYDTLNKCWTSFDLQTGGKNIKILSKIELTVRRLYAVTEDNKLYTLYIGPEPAISSFRTIGVTANIMYAGSNINVGNPKNEIKPNMSRAILNKITEDCTCSFQPYMNNRLTQVGDVVKNIVYEQPASVDGDPLRLSDVNTQLMNLAWPLVNCEQGWKLFGIFSWTGGSFTQFSIEAGDVTPMNPLASEGLS